VTLPLQLLVLHFVADFMFQNDWMAVNKSKRWDALALHVTIYSACFLGYGWQFGAITWVTHFLTDALTSRATSRLWFLPQVGSGMQPNWIQVEVKAYRHWFFVMIGFDQLIHAATLTWTWNFLK
jgi:Protein of unknown function (DUF3307)